MSIDTLRKNGTAQNNQYFTRDQLLTRHDLLEFREQLLQELKQLLTQPNTETKQWLKTFEVCKMLGISRTTLQTLRSNGTLTATKIGGLMFYAYDDIALLMKGNHTETKAKRF